MSDAEPGAQFEVETREALIDRAAYEQACLGWLERWAEYDSQWSAQGFKVLAAELEGSYPDTELHVRIHIPSPAQDIEEWWPIWRDEGALTHNGGGVPIRQPPKFLVTLYLEPLRLYI